MKNVQIERCKLASTLFTFNPKEDFKMNKIRSLSSEEINQVFESAECCGDFFKLYKQFDGLPSLQEVALEKMLVSSQTYSQAYLVYKKTNNFCLKELALEKMSILAHSYVHWDIIREKAQTPELVDFANFNISNCLQFKEFVPEQAQVVFMQEPQVCLFKTYQRKLLSVGLRSPERQVLLQQMFQVASTLEEWRALWFELPLYSPKKTIVRQKISSLMGNE